MAKNEAWVCAVDHCHEAPYCTVGVLRDGRYEPAMLCKEHAEQAVKEGRAVWGDEAFDIPEWTRY